MLASTESTRSAEPAPLPARAPESGLTPARAAAAIALGLVLIVLTAVATRFTEMVTGRYITQGIPPVPAFAAILLLLAARQVTRLLAPRWVPGREQVLIVYVMMTIGVTLSGAYQLRAFLPHLVSMQYQALTSPAAAVMADYARDLPAWFAPRDPEAIRNYYNGAPDHAVPWGVWAGPIAAWTLFLTALVLAGFCMVWLVQKRWIRDERLTFPLLNIPLAMASEDWSPYGPRATRRALFAMGFGVAALFNGANILHVLVPAVPAPGFTILFAQYFPDRPWTPLGNMGIYFMLEAIGIGYFVPLEVTFSTWFFYFANRIFAVLGTAAGYDRPGFPYTAEQSAGGYLAVGLLLLIALRRHLRASLGSVLRRGPRSEEESTERWAWIGLVASTAFILGFCHLAGFSLALAAPYMAAIALFVLVYARIRAETGVPFGFIYPFTLPKEMIINALGVEGTLSLGGRRSFVLFSSFAWMGRHHLAMEQAAYQLDGVKISQEAGIRRRVFVTAVALAFLVGLGAAFWVHLSAYYDVGSNMAGGGGGGGEWRAVVAAQEYQQMASRIADAPPRDIPRLEALGGGFLFTAALYWLRLHWLGSPFHPLGFVLATAYGDSANPMWFPLMVAWLLKASILRAGGLSLYRRGIPFFLGLAMGHFFMAGVFWPVLSLFIAPEASQAYHLYFGG
ncbi:MAG: hypothetical protein IT208_16870 [Chthonomonadales bacterium]|nr:hypothetical protein [Chthonomonadales bacterium]